MTLDLFRYNSSGVLVPFRGSAPPPPPPPTGAKQVIGSSIPIRPVQGTNLNYANERARLADLFGWEAGGPPIERMYRTQELPPYEPCTTAASQGRIPWVSTKAGSSGVNGDMTGASDARWDAWGEYFADFYPQRIWFTYEHETDADFTQTGGPNVATVVKRIRDRFDAADPVHGNSHVEMILNLTGYCFNKVSNKDPGWYWDKDAYDVVSSDPYDFWLRNDGVVEKQGGSHFLWTPTNYAPTSGFSQFYQWCMDPMDWYDEQHPSWTPPTRVTNNLDQFPVRMAIGETGTQFDMRPNANNTQWVFNDDPDDPNNAYCLWLENLAYTLVNVTPRVEAVSYWPNSTNTIGASAGRPNYFQGPVDKRWGGYMQAVVDKFNDIVNRPEHSGAITPWGPGGLL